MSSEIPTSVYPTPKPPRPGYGPFDLLWLALRDIPTIMRTLKFAVWVLLILAVFTLAGTILPQERFARDEATFAAQYASLFHVDPGDGRTGFGEILYYYVVVPLELYRVFDTGLYFVLLCLLAISSTLCASDRLRLARAINKRIEAAASTRRIKALPHNAEGTAPVPLAQAGERARRFLRGGGFQVFEAEDESGALWLFARKNVIRHIASVGFHLAFALILIGGIIGHDRVLGYEGVMAIREGQSRPVGNELKRMREAEAAGESYKPQSDAVIELIEYENIYREEDFPGIDPDTGFPLEYHGTPSDYVSHVRILQTSLDGGEEVLAGRAIEVNHPLRYGGVAYYQTSIDTLLHFTVHLPGGEDMPVETFLNRPFRVPGFDLECTVRPGDIAGGVWEESDGTRTPLPYVVRLVDYRDYLARRNERPLLVGYVSENRTLSVEGVAITLDEVEEYTVLQYVHDPGVPIVYLGGLLLIVGLTIALYLPYRTARLVLRLEGDRTTYLAGASWREFPDDLARVLGGARLD